MGERFTSIFICEDPDEINPALASIGWAWMKPSTGQWSKWNGSEWEKVDITFAKIEATEIEVADMEVTNKLEVPGGEGIDTVVNAAGITLRFSKGVLYEHEEE